MSAKISLLQSLPPGVAQANEQIAGLDACLLLGFARLGPAQHEALETIAGTFAGTPLAGPLNEALTAVRRNEFVARHFCAIASARTAIQGAQYDALFEQAGEALGRKAPTEEAPAPKPLSAEGQHTAWLASTQQWLMELALAGFKHLAAESLTPFMATLEQMQGDPKLARLVHHVVPTQPIFIGAFLFPAQGFPIKEQLAFVAGSKYLDRRYLPDPFGPGPMR